MTFGREAEHALRARGIVNPEVSANA
jgi:hypothetical protein